MLGFIGIPGVSDFVSSSLVLGLGTMNHIIMLLVCIAEVVIIDIR